MVSESPNSPSPPVPDISKNSVMLVLRLERAGNRRKVESSAVQVDADEDAISVSKELLDSDELRQVASFDSQVRRWLYARSLPSYGALKDGVYRLPLSLVEAVNDKLTAFAGERAERVERFLARYGEQMEEAKTRLRVLYNESDYAPAEVVRRQFAFQYRYLTFGVPGNLKLDILHQEQEKARVEVASEVEEIKTALRAGFMDLLEHATERLGVTKAGKKMVFRDSLISNLEEFFQFFGARNIVDDTALATLVQRARNVMQGVNADTLREDGDARTRVLKALNRVKTEMDKNLMVKPSRRLMLERKKEA